jgi:hypothetical protein
MKELKGGGVMCSNDILQRYVITNEYFCLLPYTADCRHRTFISAVTIAVSVQAHQNHIYLIRRHILKIRDFLNQCLHIYLSHYYCFI